MVIFLLFISFYGTIIATFIHYFYIMWMNLKRFKQDYDTYEFQQKKQTVLIMLESLLWKWDNFDTIYHFILQNPTDVLESELDEVFWVLIVSMYKDAEIKFKTVDTKLQNIRDKMYLMKQQELKEKKQEDADIFLDEAFAMI